MNWIERLSRIFAFLVGIAAALLMLITGFIGYGHGNVTGWQKINATVIASNLERSDAVRGGTFCPAIMVGYRFQEKQHQSRLQTKSLPCSPVKSAANRIVAKYYPGLAVEIFIDPKKPYQAVTGDYRISPMVYVSAIIGAFAFVAAFFALFYRANWSVKRDAPQAARPLP